jgi:hypothetical protein
MVHMLLKELGVPNFGLTPAMQLLPANFAIDGILITHDGACKRELVYRTAFRACYKFIHLSLTINTSYSSFPFQILSPRLVWQWYSENTKERENAAGVTGDSTSVIARPSIAFGRAFTRMNWPHLIQFA